MKIGLLNEIDSTGFKKFLKTIDKLWKIILTVFNKRPSQAIGDPEFPVVFSNQFK
jgi:hypothetical protein